MNIDEVRQAICKLLSEAEVIRPEDPDATNAIVVFNSLLLAERFHDLVQQLPVGG